MEKKILVLSNSPDDRDFNNTLSKFRMTVPADFLDPEKRWQVCAKKVGIHFQLNNPLCTQKNGYPEIIQINKREFEKAKQVKMLQANVVVNEKKLPLDLFPESSKIFVDGSKSYTAKTLAREIHGSVMIKKKYFPSIWTGTPINYSLDTKTIELGQYLFDEEINDASSEEKDGMRTFIFIHKNLAEILNINTEKYANVFTMICIDDEIYYRCHFSKDFCSGDNYPIKTQTKRFDIEMPKIIRIVSPNISERIVNGDYYHLLKEFICDYTGGSKYIQKSFTNLEYLEIGIKQNTSIQIILLDEKFQQLKLRRGLASYVELSCKEMATQSQQSFPINISSQTSVNALENSPANFKVILPHAIDLSHRKNARIALTSISMPNDFEILPGSEMDILFMDYDTEKITFHRFPKDGSIKTLTEIQNWFWTIGEDYFTVIKRRTNVYRFKKNVGFILGRDIGSIIGLGDPNPRLGSSSIHVHKEIGSVGQYYFRPDNSSEAIDRKKKIETMVDKFHLAKNIDILYNQNIIKSFIKMGNFVITGEKNAELICTFKPRSIELFPRTLYIYADFIDYSVIYGEYRQLLKVITLPESNIHYFTIEYDKPEYIALNHSVLQHLHFAIKTHDGRNIKLLRDDSVLYITLNIVTD